MKLTINPAQRILITFEGVEYPCTKPKVGAVMDLEAEIAQAKEEGKPVTRLVAKHLVSCGLPEEVVKQLDVDQVSAVSEVLAPAKKN